MNDGAGRRPDGAVAAGPERRELLWATGVLQRRRPHAFTATRLDASSSQRGNPGPMHRWKVGDETWARFYELETDRYVARLYGHVIGVGPKGFAVRLVKPAPKQPRTARYPHSATLWPTREEAEAAIAAQPSPETPGTPRNLRGGGGG